MNVKDPMPSWYLLVGLFVGFAVAILIGVVLS